jgi:hypothetical protein
MRTHVVSMPVWLACAHARMIRARKLGMKQQSPQIHELVDKGARTNHVHARNSSVVDMLCFYTLTSSKHRPDQDFRDRRCMRHKQHTCELAAT